MLEMPNREDNQHRGNLQPYSRPQRRRDQVKYGAGEENGEIQRGEVVMQEELSAHEKERKVVEAPPEEKEPAERVVFHHFGCERRYEGR